MMRLETIRSRYETARDDASVFLLSYDYPFNDGGIARLCEAIAIVGVGLGIPVHVVAPHPASRRTVASAAVPETRVCFRRPWRGVEYLLGVAASSHFRASCHRPLVSGRTSGMAGGESFTCDPGSRVRADAGALGFKSQYFLLIRHETTATLWLSISSKFVWMQQTAGS
jgi:hypothetical protein